MVFVGVLAVVFFLVPFDFVFGGIMKMCFAKFQLGNIQAYGFKRTIVQRCYKTR